MIMRFALLQYPDEQESESPAEQLGDICAAADLLLAVFSQMRLLAPIHEELARALTSLGGEAQHRLRALQETIDLLLRAEPGKRGPLRMRATLLIKYLFDEPETHAPRDEFCEPRNPPTLH